MKDELEKVKLRRNPAAAQRAAAAAAATAGAPPPSTGLIPKTLSAGALVCGALYAVPVFGAMRALGFYRMALVNILALFATNLWSRFPKTMATLQDPAFRSTQEVQAFMLCIFMLMSPPMPFALMPFLTGAFLNAVHGFAGPIASLPEFAKSRLVYFTTAEGIFQAHAFGAVSEVIVTVMGPMLIVVQGYRALLLTFFYFQYVARRYKTNQQTSQSVRLLTEKVDGVVNHRLVPAPLRAVYGKAKNLIGFAANRFT